MKADPGSAQYGAPARVLFWVDDDSGVTRDIVQIYDGGKVVFGMRTEWNDVNTDDLSYRYLDLPLPTTIEPGYLPLVPHGAGSGRQPGHGLRQLHDQPDLRAGAAQPSGRATPLDPLTCWRSDPGSHRSGSSWCAR